VWSQNCDLVPPDRWPRKELRTTPWRPAARHETVWCPPPPHEGCFRSQARGLFFRSPHPAFEGMEEANPLKFLGNPHSHLPYSWTQVGLPHQVTTALRCCPCNVDNKDSRSLLLSRLNRTAFAIFVCASRSGSTPTAPPPPMSRGQLTLSSASSRRFRLEPISHVAEKFQSCGDYTKGIARIQCSNPSCRLEYFRPFCCKGFYLCPSSVYSVADQPALESQMAVSRIVRRRRPLAEVPQLAEHNLSSCKDLAASQSGLLSLRLYCRSVGVLRTPSRL